MRNWDNRKFWENFELGVSKIGAGVFKNLRLSRRIDCRDKTLNGRLAYRHGLLQEGNGVFG